MNDTKKYALSLEKKGIIAVDWKTGQFSFTEKGLPLKDRVIQTFIGMSPQNAMNLMFGEFNDTRNTNNKLSQDR